MDFAKASGDFVDGHAGEAITAWFDRNPAVSNLYSVSYPLAAMARGCSPFLGLWATAFMMGVEFERRRRDLDALEDLK